GFRRLGRAKRRPNTNKVAVRRLCWVCASLDPTYRARLPSSAAAAVTRLSQPEQRTHPPRRSARRRVPFDFGHRAVAFVGWVERSEDPTQTRSPSVDCVGSALRLTQPTERVSPPAPQRP